ncbi:proteasomal ubiquitin receptor ADRM1 homolog [Drosophila persimilis]|uniref:proteasomal ubiquitin receptor ADRM1 homolog n=1 Tax=Drosophila persimilis TaxID=7234 RepID=UPI000F07B648|nr:proteasomal ubiquitin receptor ADRM1 homolog [Drosophila persimilis]
MKNLIEYKAGLMVLRAGMFEPDSRKGLLYVCLMETEIHICWKDRRTDRVELDILAVPGVPRFQRVSQVNTGRVYVLRFEGARERHFFWMQEAFPERDDDFCRRFNELIVASKEPEPPKIELLDPDYPRGGGGSDVPAPPPPGKLGALARGVVGFLGKVGNSMFELVKNALVPEGQAPESFLDPDLRQPESLATTMRRQMSSSLELMDFSPESLHRLMARLPMDSDREVIESQAAATGVPEAVADTLKMGLVADHVRSVQFYEALLEFESAFQRCQLVGSLEALSLGPAALRAALDGDFEGFLSILNEPGAFIEEQEDAN